MSPRRLLAMVSSLRGGGSEQQTLLLLQHLDREQFTPQLYLLDRDGDWLSRVPADVQVHAYSDARRPAAVYVPGRALRDQTQHLQQLIRQQSIDIVYDRTFHMTMIAGPACARVSVPRVSTIVSPPEFALPSVEKKFVRLKRRRLARAYRQSHAVVAVSQAAAKSAAGYYGIAADQIHVIPNGVDAKAVWIAAQQVNVDRDERLTLVCMGRMTAEKGHADLIDAVAETESGWPPATPPIRLWMIGDGPLRPQLQRQAQARCQVHEIEFCGTQNNPAAYLAAADGLVLPSHFEGLPNVVLEAMSLGTPVVATRAGGTLELERDQPTILWAEPANPPSLAAAIKAFAYDRDAAVARAAAAKQMVQQFHDVGQLTRRIEQLLRTGTSPEAR